MKTAHFILYVQDQIVSTEFYSKVLGFTPRLNVPGMTEFELPSGAVLGLMPVAGIRRLLGATISDTDAKQGIPRAELYLIGDDAAQCHQRAIAAGSKGTQPSIKTRLGSHCRLFTRPRWICFCVCQC